MKISVGHSPQLLRIKRAILKKTLSFLIHLNSTGNLKKGSFLVLGTGKPVKRHVKSKKPPNMLETLESIGLDTVEKEAFFSVSREFHLKSSIEMPFFSGR